MFAIHRHLRRTGPFAAIATLALVAAGAIAALPPAAAADVTASAVSWSDTPDGFARGTTGGAGGQTVTVTTQTQLNPGSATSSSAISRSATR